MKINYYIDLVHRPFQHGLTRLISILSALLLSALLLINPNHIADNAAQLDHGYLTILMIALSGAFVHGIGFNPIFWLWKIVFSPYFSWTVLLAFVLTMFI